MWESGYVTEVMGPRRYKVKLSNEDQLWYQHQNQLHYRHVEDDDMQSAEITDNTRTSPITEDSPHDFWHHEESAEDAETTASDSTTATGESLRGTHCYPLQDRLTSYHTVKSSTLTWDS